MNGLFRRIAPVLQKNLLLCFLPPSGKLRVRSWGSLAGEWSICCHIPSVIPEFASPTHTSLVSQCAFLCCSRDCLLRTSFSKSCGFVRSSPSFYLLKWDFQCALGTKAHSINPDDSLRRLLTSVIYCPCFLFFKATSLPCLNLAVPWHPFSAKMTAWPFIRREQYFTWMFVLQNHADKGLCRAG